MNGSVSASCILHSNIPLGFIAVMLWTQLLTFIKIGVQVRIKHTIKIKVTLSKTKQQLID